MQVILFNYEGSVAVMSVATDINLTVLKVGQKDVPAGIPFWIVESDELPSDVIPDAWELDYDTLGEPAGYGGTFSTDEAN